METCQWNKRLKQRTSFARRRQTNQQLSEWMTGCMTWLAESLLETHTNRLDWCSQAFINGAVVVVICCWCCWCCCFCHNLTSFSVVSNKFAKKLLSISCCCCSCSAPMDFYAVFSFQFYYYFHWSRLGRRKLISFHKNTKTKQSQSIQSLCHNCVRVCMCVYVLRVCLLLATAEICRNVRFTYFYI